MSAETLFFGSMSILSVSVIPSRTSALITFSTSGCCSRGKSPYPGLYLNTPVRFLALPQSSISLSHLSDTASMSAVHAALKITSPVAERRESRIIALSTSKPSVAAITAQYFAPFRCFFMSFP